MYVRVSWPESQYFMDCEDAEMSADDDMVLFVPVEIYDEFMKTQNL